MPGDLYVVIHVEEDPRFERHKQDLVYHLEISFVQAALGCRTTVPGIEEDLTLDIPKGTQNGEILTIRNQGMPHINRQSRGNLLIVIHVKTPTNLSSKQEELLREFERLGEETFLEKTKKKIKEFVGMDDK